MVDLSMIRLLKSLSIKKRQVFKKRKLRWVEVYIIHSSKTHPKKSFFPTPKKYSFVLFQRNKEINFFKGILIQL